MGLELRQRNVDRLGLEFLNKGNAVILAPMVAITNLPYRLLCRQYGADAAFTEMISATAISRNRYGEGITEISKTLLMAKTDSSDNPVGLQLFGNNADEIANAAAIMQEHYDFIDLNMGCSVRKVIEQETCVALMDNPKLAAEIISKTAQSISIPLTVKIRAGHKMDNAVEIAKIAEREGAAAITVHPRTSAQGFTGSSDWDIIKRVKDAVGIPVIGNGDIRTPEDAKRMIESTGCDAVMIGRAAIGNPFIFRQIKEYLAKGSYQALTNEDRFSAFTEYAKLCKETGMLSKSDLQAKAMWFTKGATNSTRFRDELSRIDSCEAIIDFMESLRLES